MTDTAPRFRNTPALIKWLLNERAMLAGEVHRHQVQIDALVAEVAKYSEKMAALDAAIAIADSRVNAAALGRIKAHRSDYAGRGGFTKFILAEVRAAGSVGLSTEDVARLAAKRFDVLRFRTTDRKLYRDTVRTRLRWLQEQGDIESALAIWEGKKVRVWRKRESFDSFSLMSTPSELQMHGERGLGTKNCPAPVSKNGWYLKSRAGKLPE